MTIRIQTFAKLMPGCRLLYDCPLMSGEDPASDRFFKKYRGKYARFVRYSPVHIGPLSHDGRMPGRHINPDVIVIRFEGEQEDHELNIRHFVVADAAKASFAEGLGIARIGDLSEPIAFWPEDVVRFREGADRPSEFTTNDPRAVSSVFTHSAFLHKGSWGYQLHVSDREWAELKEKSKPSPFGHSVVRPSHNVPGERLELISRGNVWALYNDPEQMVFISFEEEYAFWGQDGIAKPVIRYENDGFPAAVSGPLERVMALYEEGHGDIIRPVRFQNPREPACYELLWLHDCFAEHRPHIRSLMRKWDRLLKESFAQALAG